MLIAIGILIGLALSQPERFSLAALTRLRPASAPRVLPPSPPRTVYATLPADDEEYEADDDEAEAELPDGWEEHHDQQTGRAFYYHAATKTSTWERPSGDGAAAEDELPAGWTVHKDPGTGRPFYYSETTRESVWTHPGRRLPAGWEEQGFRIRRMNPDAAGRESGVDECLHATVQVAESGFEGGHVEARAGGGGAAAAAVTSDAL